MKRQRSRLPQNEGTPNTPGLQVVIVGVNPHGKGLASTSSLLGRFRGLAIADAKAAAKAKANVTHGSHGGHH